MNQVEVIERIARMHCWAPVGQERSDCGDCPSCLCRRHIRETGGVGMSEYTEGPWRADSHEVYATSPDGIDVWVAESCNPDDDTTSKANARLIAASPELLAAAKAVTSAYEGDLDGLRIARAFEALHAAIAKAEGRE